MAAYLVGHITVKDAWLWQHYVAAVQESLAPFRAKVMFRGTLVTVLAGRHEHDMVVVIEFPDYSALDEWFTSAKYQSLVPLRDRAADVVITSYEALSSPQASECVRWDIEDSQDQHDPKDRKDHTMHTYKGRCHCGAVSFTFTGPEIDKGLKCNCSMCIRKGAAMTAFTIAPDQMKIEAKDGALSLYQFGSKVAEHYFCNKCGIYTFNGTLRKPGHFRANLACLEGVNPLDLPTDVFDGVSL